MNISILIKFIKFKNYQLNIILFTFSNKDKIKIKSLILLIINIIK